MRPRIVDAIFRRLGVRKFDDGGWLPPHSATLAINGTDRYVRCTQRYMTGRDASGW